MNAKDAIRLPLDASERILGRYLDDLNDSDLALRPLDGINPIAWQLGHLISSEHSMLEAIKPGSSPALPDGFDAAHSREAVASGDTKGFLSKDEYLRLFQAQRAATRAVLDSINESELDNPAPERMRGFAPTVGAVLAMTGTHVLMHVGQFVIVRRQTGKPIAI
jgi:hypothetical protein